MEGQAWYRVNSPAVIYETMENEVIIINLDVGYYYCLQGLAADIWMLMLKEASIEQITKLVAQQFQQELESVRTMMVEFINQLQEENLISAHTPDVEHAVAGEFNEKTTFVEPKLQKFEDMQHLLFLDPIHEVDEQGWPSEAAIGQAS